MAATCVAAGAQCNPNSVSLWYADDTQTLGLTFWMQMLSRLVSDLLCYQQGPLLPEYPALLIYILCDMILVRCFINVGQNGQAAHHWFHGTKTMQAFAIRDQVAGP